MKCSFHRRQIALRCPKDAGTHVNAHYFSPTVAGPQKQRSNIIGQLALCKDRVSRGSGFSLGWVSSFRFASSSGACRGDRTPPMQLEWLYSILGLLIKADTNALDIGYFCPIPQQSDFKQMNQSSTITFRRQFLLTYSYTLLYRSNRRLLNASKFLSAFVLGCYTNSQGSMSLQSKSIGL